jgi:hypothetical protein
MEYLVLAWDPYIFIDLEVEKSFFFNFLLLHIIFSKFESQFDKKTFLVTLV